MEKNNVINIWQVFVQTSTGGFTRDEPIEHHDEPLGLFMSQDDALKKAKSYISEDLKKEMTYRDFYHIVCEPNWTALQQLTNKNQVYINDKPVNVNNLWYAATGKHKMLFVRPVDLVDSL